MVGSLLIALFLAAPTNGAVTFTFQTGPAVYIQHATAAHEAEIRAELRRIRELGITMVEQQFPTGATVRDWQLFLDIAQQEGLKVVPGFHHGENQAPIWDGTKFDLRTTGEFMQAMRDHSALGAIFLFDEPFHEKHGWQITTERLQMLYRQAKEIAPQVLMLVNFSRELWRIENPDYQFAAGQCDICQISTLEFRNYGRGPSFDSATATSNHTTSRKIISERDPQAEIWTSVQVFGSPTGMNYYMPSPAELQSMIDLLLSSELQEAGELDGMSFQRWTTPDPAQEAAGADSLGDPEFDAQREIVRRTSELLDVEPSETPPQEPPTTGSAPPLWSFPTIGLPDGDGATSSPPTRGETAVSCSFSLPSRVEFSRLVQGVPLRLACTAPATFDVTASLHLKSENKTRVIGRGQIKASAKDRRPRLKLPARALRKLNRYSSFTLVLHAQIAQERATPKFRRIINVSN